MASRQEIILQTIDRLARVEGVYMLTTSLVEDVAFLSKSFPSDSDFESACECTFHALSNLSAGKVTASKLGRALSGWESLHYQHRIGQGVPATCRILFCQTPEGVEVMGFGHRWIPTDFYRRMRDMGRPKRYGVLPPDPDIQPPENG